MKPIRSLLIQRIRAGSSFRLLAFKTFYSKTVQFILSMNQVFEKDLERIVIKSFKIYTVSEKETLELSIV